jgi:hypothetical protein
MMSLRWLLAAFVAACGGGNDEATDASVDALSPEARCIQDVTIGDKVCVVRKDHTVWCGTPLAKHATWGNDVAAIDGDAKCARKLDGSVWCDAGGGEPTPLAAPAPIIADGVVQFDGTAQGHCAVKSDHTLWCWGETSNTYGVLPAGATYTTATQWTSLGTRVAQLGMSSYDHACVLSTDGILYCWGSNDFGQVGNDMTSNTGPVRTPTAIAGVPMPVAIAAYTQTSCAVDASGDAYCWGTNYKGGLGDGTFVDRSSPTRVVGLPVRARTVEPAYGATFALLDDGTVWAWGSSLDGQLGDGTTVDRPTPGPVPGLSAIVDVVSENRLTCATDGGSLWCWGRTLTTAPALQSLDCPEGS